MLMVECAHFVDCLNSRKNPRTDGQHGVQTIEALEEIYPSNESKHHCVAIACARSHEMLPTVKVILVLHV